MVVNLYEHMFAVMGGKFVWQNDERKFQQDPIIQGTAFCIGDFFYLTAAHVVQELASKEIVLCYAVGNGLEGIHVIEHELLSNDVAVLKVDRSLGFPSFLWNSEELPRLANVISAGYPYGFDPQTYVVQARAFSGHIVTPSRIREVGENSRGYEISFMCPRGLSGAPLLSPGLDGVGPFVEGIIVGNRQSEINVYTDSEVEDDGKQKTIIQRYEAINYGIAISSHCIQQVNSKLLGGVSVGTYLQNKKLQK